MEIRRMGPQIGVEVRGVDVKTLDDAGVCPDLPGLARLQHSVRARPGADDPGVHRLQPPLWPGRAASVEIDAPPRTTPRSRCSGSANSTPTAGSSTRSTGAAPRAGIPTAPTIRRRSRRPSFTRWRSRAAAATRCLPTATPPTTRLPRRLKQRLDGVMGAFSYGGKRGKSALLNPEDQDWTPVYHPIIRTHPETGRKSLFFDPGKIVRIVGADERESDQLIADLTGCMIQPDAEYHHKWQKGDIVIWDNRCSYHRAAGDYPPEEDRIHWRVSINDYGVEAARGGGVSASLRDARANGLLRRTG